MEANPSDRGKGVRHGFNMRLLLLDELVGEISPKLGFDYAQSTRLHLSDYLRRLINYDFSSHDSPFV